MLVQIIYFDFAMIAIDLITIRSLRHFLLDFIRSKKNKKAIAKMHADQSLKYRITMEYIKPLLKKYVKEFAFFHMMYLSVVYTILPQYLFIFLCNILIGEKSIYVILIFAIIKLVIWLIVRSHEDANRTSIFRK